jgi:hypothetical protein
MWEYSQSSGQLVDPSGTVTGIGYSGNGPDLNRPASQDVIGHGPCPQGLYTMGPWFDDPEKGPIVTHLAPDPDNEMFGRSGFMIHGDNPAMNHTASDGCIILAHDIRVALSLSADDELNVMA